MSAEKLYSPAVLALATGLAAYPWDDDLPLQGSARSKSCGSMLDLALALGEDGTIVRIGIRAQACAVGQAAAAIFAGAAPGLSPEEIRTAAREISQWLGGDGALPDWPGLAAIVPARDFPARHGAILLAWNVATQLLPSG